MKRALMASCLLALGAADASAGTLEELLVEKGVITKSEATSVASPAGSAKVTYNNGTQIEFPDHRFNVKRNTLVQTRYQFTDNDEDGGKINNSSFDVVRARIIISGTALGKEFSYYLQNDFVGSKNDDGQK